MSPEVFDVAVVGGGPVGLSAALGLQQAGFKVVLVERGGEPAAFDPQRYDSRVYAIAPASARLLDRLGAWPAILEQRASVYTEMRVWDRMPERALAFVAEDAGIEQLGWIVEHGLITRALWDARGSLPVRLKTAVERLVREDDSDKPATLWLDDGSSISARLIVAADGADSHIRELAGIEAVTWRYDQQAIVCHVQMSEPHRATAWQRFLPSGPLGVLPLADGRCSIVWSANAALVDELMALDDASFRKRLDDASQYAMGEAVKHTPRIVVPLRLLHAQDYVQEGLALVGDAAHAIHPLAGQGLNLGLADVASLIETVAGARDARRDWRSARALGRFARERKASNLEMLALTDGLSRVFGLRVPGLKVALGLGLTAVNRLGPVKQALMRQAASR